MEIFKRPREISARVTSRPHKNGVLRVRTSTGGFGESYGGVAPWHSEQQKAARGLHVPVHNRKDVARGDRWTGVWFQHRWGGCHLERRSKSNSCRQKLRWPKTAVSDEQWQTATEQWQTTTIWWIVAAGSFG